MIQADKNSSSRRARWLRCCATDQGFAVRPLLAIPRRGGSRHAVTSRRRGFRVRHRGVHLERRRQQLPTQHHRSCRRAYGETLTDFVPERFFRCPTAPAGRERSGCWLTANVWSMCRQALFYPSNRVEPPARTTCRCRAGARSRAPSLEIRRTSPGWAPGQESPALARGVVLRGRCSGERRPAAGRRRPRRDRRSRLQRAGTGVLSRHHHGTRRTRQEVQHR